MMARINRVLGSPRMLAVLALAMAITAWAATSAGWASPARNGTDPGAEPIPVLDFDDPAKAMIVRLSFDSRTEVTFESASVSLERARSHIGDPPLLELQLFDDQGGLLESFSAWHPLWAFMENADGSESRITLPSASGSFVFPFSPDLGVVRVFDIPLDQELIEVDLTPAIRSFCVENPSDPDCEIADLAIVAMEEIDPPPFILVGDADELTVRISSTNHGPDGPTDAEVTTAFSAPTGVTVSPEEASDTLEALAVAEVRVTDQVFNVQCNEPGVHMITFASVIDAVPAAVSDPDLTNNSQVVEIAIDCATPVTINIKPGSVENPVNLKGGTIPVAVLTIAGGEYGNPVAVDATSIDPLSVRFGDRELVLAAGGATEQHARGHIEDAIEIDETTYDGDMDMVLHFGVSETGLTMEDAAACLVGELVTASGATFTFFGCDSIWPVSPG